LYGIGIWYTPPTNNDIPATGRAWFGDGDTGVDVSDESEKIRVKNVENKHRVWPSAHTKIKIRPNIIHSRRPLNICKYPSRVTIYTDQKQYPSPIPKVSYARLVVRCLYNVYLCCVRGRTIVGWMWQLLCGTSCCTCNLFVPLNLFRYTFPPFAFGWFHHTDTVQTMLSNVISSIAPAHVRLKII